MKGKKTLKAISYFATIDIAVAVTIIKKREESSPRRSGSEALYCQRFQFSERLHKQLIAHIAHFFLIACLIEDLMFLEVYQRLCCQSRDARLINLRCFVEKRFEEIRILYNTLINIFINFILSSGFFLSI